ncbi:alpha-(1,6)-fucosyltransferase-like [Penaeus japonicus]|uniref:alpha-(1,6)-fucosyltransferase-like n=1 Tax=Penaeus japonicus TaxID=27405 RepID=UPI001C70F51A|nr:alpha-(1,6)-fucosyltransferase-like [Penaeus japonicus]
MNAADDFFDDLEIQGTKVTRRIYLATDDPKVLQEAKEKYPHYELVCNEESVASASMKLRGTESNMRNFLTDVYFLSRSDFLVCSMSSNVCRLAYELMQSLHPDASRRVFSVDSTHWFHLQTRHWVRARYAHSSGRRTGELRFKKGDVIKVIPQYYKQHYNHFDGFVFGMNKNRTNYGLFPMYKTVDDLQVADTPSFDHIDRRERTNTTPVAPGLEGF